MSTDLNPWLESTVRKAQRICEDSDRRWRTDRMFLELVRRVHFLASTGAHGAPTPTIERVDNEGQVSLLLEWHDRESGWHLYFAVRRQSQQKPVVVLDFCGNPDSYSAEAPSREDMRKALHDYFHAWKVIP